MIKILTPIVVSLFALFILYTGGATLVSMVVAYALLVCVATYVMSRDEWIMTVAIGLQVLVFPRFIFPTAMQNMRSNNGVIDTIQSFVSSDGFAITLAGIVTVIAFITALATPLGGRRVKKSQSEADIG